MDPTRQDVGVRVVAFRLIAETETPMVHYSLLQESKLLR